MSADVKMRLPKAAIISGVVVLLMTSFGSYWLWNGGKRPLKAQIVRIEAGNSGLGYTTGVESRVSSAIRWHPFASHFKVQSDFFIGGGGSNITYEYNRHTNTLSQQVFDFDRDSGSQQREYLYQGVTDAALHALAAEGKWLDELEAMRLGVRRQVVLKKQTRVGAYYPRR